MLIRLVIATQRGPHLSEVAHQVLAAPRRDKKGQSVGRATNAQATHAVEVTRGGATKPLYVTYSGRIAIAEAASILAAMAGPHRLPFALARVDSLARGRAQPIFD